MKIFLIVFASIFICSNTSFAQYKSKPNAAAWADSVLASLTKEQKIAQLMIIRAHSNLGAKHVNEVTNLINTYNIGGLCFFQGGPVRQANLTNYYQSIAKTPLLISIDGEWGLGMRLDSVMNFPRQLMIGAVPDAQLVYEFGRAVGEQCKRLGIHMNYAPVIDVNNNPNNPVINDRSFGEDKYKVALFGSQYMKGMQDVGVIACAKHFPGHGDVSVDSHFDLPVINKTRAQLDSFELYPFRQLIKEDVGAIMVAHLAIPAIDSRDNRPTSLSKSNVTDLLKNELGYNGLVITDGLEMKGVTKFFPDGQASVEALIAGNDLLCLPGDVKGSIAQILLAIQHNQLQWSDIDARVKKVLIAKYNAGLNQPKTIDTNNLVADLNKYTTDINKELASNAITIVRNQSDGFFPLDQKKKVAFVGIGLSFNKLNTFSNRLKQDYNADIYTFNYQQDLGSVAMMVATLKDKYDAVIVGIHNYSRVPVKNFGISYSSIDFVQKIGEQIPSATFVFGNPYSIQNIANIPTLVAAYEDNEIVQNKAADLLLGKLAAKGTLPVTVSDSLPFGTANAFNNYFPMVAPEEVGLSSQKLDAIDSIAADAIQQKATPGCVVLVAKNGKVAFYKSYGYTNYDNIELLKKETIYDLASVTKISATTVSLMKLYEEGKVDLKKTLGDYIPWVNGTDKASLTIENILLHQAGLIAYIPFYTKTLDATGKPLPLYYSNQKDSAHAIKVAENLYLRNDYRDSLYQIILASKLSAPNNYIYSDNDFIFLAKVVEAVTNKPLDEYARETFYAPLNMVTTSFKPLEHFPVNQIAPTEKEKAFRQQQLRGDVHDPGAAMFGGVAGHAGLFSNAYDLAQLYQMLLNGGELNGVRYLKKETIDYFTDYHSSISRRGFGFDKPEKDNATRKVPYPTRSASPQTYGHTGFTGTCVWVDPVYDLIYIFLSNRVAPNGSDANKLLQINTRSNIHEAIYDAMIDGKK